MDFVDFTLILWQKRGTVIKTKMSMLSILQQILTFRMLETFGKKPIIWRRYLIIHFSFENMVNEKSLSDQEFVDQISMFHSTMKFTAEYSNEEVSVLDLNIKLYQQSMTKVPELDLSFLFMFLIIHIYNNIKIKLTK